MGAGFSLQELTTWILTKYNCFSVISGIIGCYKIESAFYFPEVAKNWHFINITWNRETNAFTWTNKAGVSWTLTPIFIDSELDTTRLALGLDCPYYKDENKYATFVWEGLPGSSNVSIIKGMRELYHPCSYNPKGMYFPLNECCGKTWSFLFLVEVKY